MAATATAPAAFDAAQTHSYPPDMSFVNGVEQTYSMPSLSHQDSTLSAQDMSPATATPTKPITDTSNPAMATPMDTRSFLPQEEWLPDPNAPLGENQDGVMADLQSYEAEEAASPNAPMQAFAKLQFTDGDFYVNTYAVELGRDMNAMKAERRRNKKKQQKEQETKEDFQEEQNVQDNPQDGHRSSIDSQIPKPRAQNALSFSNVSETGGMIGANVYSDDEEGLRPRKRRKKLLHSEESSQSQSIAPKNLHNVGNGLSFTSQLFPDGQVLNGDDLAAPVTEECPFIPIHPPAGKSTGSISRKQIRIEYNSVKAVWEMHVLGRNGAWLDDELYMPGDVVRLNHGSEIIMQSVCVVFKLPDNARDDEGEANESEDADSALSSVGSSPLGGHAIAIEDESDASSTELQEHLPRPKLKLSLGKRMAEVQKQTKKDNEKEKEKPSKSGKQPSKSAKQPSKSIKEPAKTKTEPPENDDKMADIKPLVEQSEADPTAKDATTETPSAPPADLPAGSILAGLAPEEIPQKRKGPGRPPKNGVMSKRDEAIIKRKKKELQKAGQEIPPLAELLAMARAEAGSTTKKDKTDDVGGDDDVKASIEPHSAPTLSGSGSIPANDTSANAAARPSQPSAEGDAKAKRVAKSPSPQKPEAEYTEEELKKPPKTYVVLIHEAISKSQTGIMDLQQIYDAIQKMYPYYKYRSQTQGWQSSIRHNLIGSEAFEEAGKIGKGRLWKNNPNFNIDKEKKRKAPTPPPERPAFPASYYGGGQYGYGANQSYSAYGSPYGRPYGQPTTLPAGARPPTTHTPSRPGGTYFSPYANQPGQTHASPYGPPSRPPYAQTARPPTGPPNALQSGATAVGPQNASGSIQPPAASFQQNGQPPRPQSSTPQPAQAQNALGSETTIDDIMNYHKKFLGNYKPGAEQDAARELFRKAVARHIDKTKDHGPYSSPEEETIVKTVGEIIIKNQREQETRKSQPPAAMATNGQAVHGAQAGNGSHPPNAVQSAMQGVNGAAQATAGAQATPTTVASSPTTTDALAAQKSASERELVKALQTATAAPPRAALSSPTSIATKTVGSISAAVPAPLAQPMAASTTAGTSKQPIDLDAGDKGPSATSQTVPNPTTNGGLKRLAEEQGNEPDAKKPKV